MEKEEIVEEIVIEPCPKNDPNGNPISQVRFRNEGEKTHYNLITMEHPNGNDCFIYYSDRIVDKMIKEGVLTDNS